MALPLTLLAGPSTALRDDLVRCLVLRRPGLVAVVYDVEPGASSAGWSTLRASSTTSR